MAWRLYPVRAEVLTPVHAGAVPAGNIMRTRRYVPGKAIWGAATASLVEHLALPSKAESYQSIGQLVHEHYRFGCLFPSDCADFTTKPEHWTDADLFEYQFIGTYSSTAIDNGAANAAEANSLHEIEAIRARTRPSSEGPSRPIFLLGYLWSDGPPDLSMETMRAALMRCQIGGKRTSGFGGVSISILDACSMYFGATITDDGVIDWSPDIPAPALVEMHPDIQPAKGIPEPFVGREWRGADGAGLYVSTPVFCWQPGAKFNEGRQFTIGDYGVWRIAR